MLASAWFGLVLIGAAFAAEPTRCCFDNQYSVTLGEVGEVLTGSYPGKFIDGYIHVGFDYYRDREGLVSVLKTSNGFMSQVYELKDYATRRVYTKVDNNTCTYTDLPSFDVIRPSCIPGNATYLGSSVFGYGAHSLKVHNWEFNYRMGADKSTQVMISVTQEHCVPVIESFIGNYLGTRMEQSLFFTNYHPGIEHLNSLDIPTGCQPLHASAAGR